MLAGLSAVICVSVYQMILNRTRNERIGRFIQAFRFFLQIPLYCLVRLTTPDALSHSLPVFPPLISAAVRVRRLLAPSASP